MARQSTKLKLEFTSAHQELDYIRKRDGGIISPSAVVEFARQPSTHLHNRFDWNNSTAAEKYRLWQARQIISLELTVIEIPKQKGKKVIDLHVKPLPETRAFISLSTERGTEGGYMSIEDILENPNLRVQLLEDAKHELATFRKKYAVLNELAKVFQAIDEL